MSRRTAEQIKVDDAFEKALYFTFPLLAKESKIVVIKRLWEVMPDDSKVNFINMINELYYAQLDYEQELNNRLKNTPSKVAGMKQG